MRKLLLGLAMCALAMAETGVSGKWVGGPFLFTLQQDGNKLSGTGGPGASEQYPLKNGVIEGGRATFSIGTFQFDLHLEGATIKGEVKMEGQTYPVILQRAEAAKAGGPAAFEVASVKPSPPEVHGSTMHLDPGRLTCSGASLKELIQRAYNIKNYQISGPDWLDTERYEIAAKFPGTYGVDQVVQALQALLVERFRLTVHRESKEMAVYGLVVGKGGFKFQETEIGAGGISGYRGKLVAKKVSMARLAEFLSTRVDRPVIDMTGISGIYDFTLEWAPDGNAPADSGPTADIYTAIEQQLGLKLETRKAPVEMLVIDHAEKVPIEN
jgi:uncharacterized protein (TIGR03435 family)